VAVKEQKMASLLSEMQQVQDGHEEERRKFQAELDQLVKTKEVGL